MGDIQSIVEQCKEIKRKLGYTNQFIAEQSGVPEGTVSRVFGSKQYNFKYDTIQPIVAFLAEMDVDGALSQPNNDVIALYEDIVAGKNRELAELKAEHKTEVNNIKAEHRAAVAELRAEHQKETERVRKTNRHLRTVLCVIIGILVVLAIIDLSFTSFGWWRGFPA